jgi:uncharacterized protein (DUF952 family)
MWQIAIVGADRLRTWWRPREFSIPGIKISLVVGIAAALLLRLVDVGPLWLTLALAPVGVFVLSWAAAVAAGTLLGPKLLFHLAIAREWDDARSGGEPYRRSTLGVSLEEQGFIHCSLPRQLQSVADAVFAGRDDVVLLFIDAGRLTADVKVETADDGGERFPHIYGPLNLDAVIDSVPVPLGPDGRLDVHGLFRAGPRDFFQP